MLCIYDDQVENGVIVINDELKFCDKSKEMLCSKVARTKDPWQYCSYGQIQISSMNSCPDL